MLSKEDLNFYVDPLGHIAELKEMIKRDKENKMTYGDIFQEFLTETRIDRQNIEDYQPCCEMFDVPNISNAIVVWLRNGAKIIYVSKGNSYGHY